MKDPNQKHFVSIIIPALNEEKNIKNCLLAIKGLTFAKNEYEIIVVDNGSKDKSAEIAKQCGVRVLTKINGTIGALRNHGVKYAQGDIIAFVDADCQVQDAWLRYALRYFEDPKVAAVGSRLDHLASTWVSKCWSLMHHQKMMNGEVNWVPSGNMVVRRKYYDEIEGFDEKLITSEDYDLCLRLRSKGYKIISDLKMRSIHLDPPKTLHEFYEKEIWHGQGMIRTFLKRDAKVQRALIYAIYCLICMVSLLIGVIIGLLKENYLVILISSCSLFFVPLVLAIKTSFFSKQYKYVFALMLMYVVYGIARANSLIGIKKLGKSGKGTK